MHSFESRRFNSLDFEHPSQAISLILILMLFAVFQINIYYSFRFYFHNSHTIIGSAKLNMGIIYLLLLELYIGLDELCQNGIVSRNEFILVMLYLDSHDIMCSTFV